MKDKRNLDTLMQRQTVKQEIGVAMLVYLKGPHSKYLRGRGRRA